MGGAIGTPLLLLVTLLLMILMCHRMIKRKFNRLSSEPEIMMQRNEVYGEIRIIFDETQRTSVLNSPHAEFPEEDDIYTSVQ